MNYLSLFSGVAGGDLGLQHLLGWTCKGYIEYEPFCQKVLKQRITDGLLDAAPIFGDIRKFIQENYAETYQGMVDCITGGFPCQPFSVAGKRRGSDDERNMWPATLQIVQIIRPKFVYLENVPGLLSSGYFGEILRGLHEAGYDAKWRMLSAEDVGAPHKRQRLWICATNTECNGININVGISRTKDKREISNGLSYLWNQNNWEKIGSNLSWSIAEWHLRNGNTKDTELIPDPCFYEMIMGWPVSWTDLKPLAMGKFRKWLRLHGKS